MKNLKTYNSEIPKISLNYKNYVSSMGSEDPQKWEQKCLIDIGKVKDNAHSSANIEWIRMERDIRVIILYIVKEISETMMFRV